MPYKVFVSYSTADFPLVEHTRRLLTTPAVGVFIAETSVSPGTQFNDTIVDAIKTCDLFVLLWSRNSQFSEYVPQEIGIARGRDKIIVPIVLEEGLQLPGFIKEVQYLPAYRNPAESLIWLQRYILARAEEKRGGEQLTTALVLVGLAALFVWLFRQR